MDPALQKYGQRLIILVACCSTFPQQIYTNGVLLLYLSSLQMNGTLILTCLAMMPVTMALLLVPSAYVADRMGLKRSGLLGIGLTIGGVCGLLASTLLPLDWAKAGVVAGILVQCVGTTIFSGGWFALMIPLIAVEDRAGFFGRVRFAWQSVCAILGFIVSAILSQQSSREVFGGIFFVLFLMGIGWVLTYRRIPDLSDGQGASAGFLEALMRILRTEHYLPFCAYAFLLALFSGGCSNLFGLVEKAFLKLPDGAVSLLANLRLLGAIAGFVLGGKTVERLGTKYVFLGCHFGLGSVIGLFLLRDLTGIPLPCWLGLMEALFGLLMAASSVAFATEILALIPSENQALSTSLFFTLQGGGTALSSLLSAGAIKLGLFQDRWGVGGMALSGYDAVLLIYGTMIVVFVVALGLVPSVIGKPQWVPSDQSRTG